MYAALFLLKCVRIDYFSISVHRVLNFAFSDAESAFSALPSLTFFSPQFGECVSSSFHSLNTHLCGGRRSSYLLDNIPRYIRALYCIEIKVFNLEKTELFPQFYNK